MSCEDEQEEFEIRKDETKEERLIRLSESYSARCTNCRYSFIKDVGYSNYTVEGHYFGCKLAYFDAVSHETYELDDKMPYLEALECNDYRVGKPERFYVEDRCPFKY